MIDQTNDAERSAGEELLATYEERVRVLVADHDGLARTMLRTALTALDRVAIVLTAGNGREAHELARYYRPTIAIIDTALPPHGAVELIHKVALAAPATRVLTASVDDHQTVLRALRAGAVGHIDKDIDPDELARLVVRAAEGEAIIPQRLLLPMLERLREVPDTGWRPLHSRLTNREWEIIELLAADATTQQIAERLVLSPTTVYSHIKNLLRKLDVHTRREAIIAAQRLRREEARKGKPLFVGEQAA